MGCERKKNGAIESRETTRFEFRVSDDSSYDSDRYPQLSLGLFKSPGRQCWLHPSVLSAGRLRWSDGEGTALLAEFRCWQQPLWESVCRLPDIEICKNWGTRSFRVAPGLAEIGRLEAFDSAFKLTLGAGQCWDRPSRPVVPGDKRRARPWPEELV